jgi:hypothetical protein
MASVLVPAPRELIAVDSTASVIDRIEARVANIELLCNAVYREILLLGNELSECKWSGDYLLDPKWNEPDNAARPRTWINWLKHARKFVLRQESSEIKIDEKKAANLMAWSSCYATLAAENRERQSRGLLPLPLPTTHAQLQPYQALFTRVDDWSAEEAWPEEVKAVAHSNAIRDTEPPYAEEQPRFLAKWEEICSTMPVEKRQTPDGLMAPPTRDFSQNYLTREREIALKERKAKEAKNKPPEEEKPALTVGSKPQSSQTRAAGTSTKPPKAPEKSQEQLEAEAHEAALRKDITDYRNGLHNLRVSADALEALLKNILVKNGDGRLAEMRARTDLGIYAVDEDMGLLRGAVETCQRIYKLVTEPYVPPTPISRHEVDPTTATVEV